MVELIDRAAIELPRRDEFVAWLQQRVEAQELGRVARCDSKRGRAALQRRDALLQHRIRRIADARIDVAEGLQPEQRGGMVDIVEDEGCRLVDRGGARARRCVRSRAGVNRERIEAGHPVGHGVLPENSSECETVRSF